MEEFEHKTMTFFIYYGIALFIVFLMAHGGVSETRVNALVDNYQYDKEELEAKIYNLEEELFDTQARVEEIEEELCKYKDCDWVIIGEANTNTKE